MPDDKRVVSRIYVEPDTHTELLNKANEEGEPLASFIGHVLDEVMETWEPPDADSKPEKRLYWNWVRSARRKRQRDRVYHAAAVYAAHPDERGAEALEAMCEDAGLDYSEIRQTADNDPFSSIIAASRDGTKFGACLKWLPGVLIEHDGKMATMALKAVAKEKGFSESMLDRVKRAINNDPETPRIQSVRMGHNWEWQLVE